MMMPEGHHYKREELERLKRSELQKICKDYGLRANMKTETLVDELLETIRSNIAPLVPPPQAQRQAGPMTRRASTRSRTSSRSTTAKSRGASGSSAAKSDVADTLVATSGDGGSVSGAETFSSQNTAASRNRKSKDTQLRLGVGRPVAAGGPGARAVTRTVSRAPRGRVSRSVKVVEETIQEESEIEQPVATTSSTHIPDVELYPTMIGNNATQGPIYPENEIFDRLTRVEMLLQDANFKQHFNSLQGLPDDVAWLKRFMQERDIEFNNLKSDLQACRLELLVLRNEAAKIGFIEAELKNIKENLNSGRFTLPSSNSGTPGSKGTLPRRVSIPLGESNINTSPQRATSHLSDENASIQPAALMSRPVTPGNKYPLPVQPPTTLGKRHRDSATSELMEAFEDNSGKDLTRRVLRPSKKKAKLSDSDGVASTSSQPTSSGSGPTSDGHVDSNDACSTSSGPSTVPPVGTPPPSEHLPEFFADSVGGLHTSDEAGDASIVRNGPFGSDSFYPFTFGAASSTPRGGAYPFVDTTFSPGSALKIPGTRGASGAGGPSFSFDTRRISTAAARPRTPTRSTGPDRFRVDASPVQQEMGPADAFNYQLDDDMYGLGFQGRDIPAGSIPNALPIQFGIGYGTGSDESSSPIQSAQTRYGTELANDTRFGDFGRDGVASSSGRQLFWGGMY